MLAHLKNSYTGIVKSPNFPAYYPRGIDHRQTIQVEEGKTLRLEFTKFAVSVCGDLSTCSCDYVNITDGNGEVLMDRSCGFSLDELDDLYFKPTIITSTSNSVDIFFHTASNESTIATSLGWSINYTAVITGLMVHNLIQLKIESLFSLWLHKYLYHLLTETWS